jgi:tRNA-2-methylthio-N6-dimethylallyladenosine synthase
MTELQSKDTIEEVRQGEAYAPFALDENKYSKYFYVESYGCAMNFSDTEIIASILYDAGYGATKNLEEADLIFINTCSIREKAEQTVRNRLVHFRGLKRTKKHLLIGVLGCMAERLKAKLLEEEQLVDIVIGPDAYRSLPSLIKEAEGGQKGVNVLLSRDETYADIAPVRLDSNGVSAFVSIMRGCNNMCSFCVVPFTRGRERSRNARSILAECKDLFDRGYKEVTLLGQNVDSYLYTDDNGHNTNFAELLKSVAAISPQLRVRFSTSHPKDITDEVLYAIKEHENICNYIHLPIQSGNTRILQLMNRTYTREWYIKKIDRIREILPVCDISTDIISGFCSESEDEHQDTLSIIEYAKFSFAYMYTYSERPGTLAERRYTDDIPEATKSRRLAEIITVQRKQSHAAMLADIGTTQKVLVESVSKRSADDYCGRADSNKMVVFPKGNAKIGDYVFVKITDATSGTLLGTILPEA